MSFVQTRIIINLIRYVLYSQQIDKACAPMKSLHGLDVVKVVFSVQNLYLYNPTKLTWLKYLINIMVTS